MRYSQSKSESAEILRLVVPRMGGQGSGCQPPSYALWYEYVAGVNRDLALALDERLKQGKPLTDDETLALYGKYVAERDFVTLDHAQDRLQRSLDTLKKLATMAGNDLSVFGDSLRSCEDRLSVPIDDESLGALVATLATEVQRMRRSNQALGEQLEASQRELQDANFQLSKVRSESLLDPLTKLYNRRGLQEGVKRLMLDRPQGLVRCALLMADIDHFKRINDQYGHLFGDRVLRSVAQVMTAFTKGRGLAARFGGEEFAIVLPDTEDDGAVGLAEQIRCGVATGRIRREGQDVDLGGVTISLGVALYRLGETFEQWACRADAALYNAKNAGRNRVAMAQVC